MPHECAFSTANIPKWRLSSYFLKENAQLFLHFKVSSSTPCFLLNKRNGEYFPSPISDKLVFIGDLQSRFKSGSRRVDLMDLSTGQVSSLPDTIKARLFPDGVATENEIFVYETDVLSKSPDRFSKEVYEAALGRRVIF
ncbi:unnamed protein product [Hymenolepis diminuta]|uniref:Uncharacterized protein n=1 Tax=Hymenolepis diminuta TaxID=6216 RepID=A0A564ZA21_HYMDI|nr:unnamed protein product [Hymenolepis diminuta]